MKLLVVLCVLACIIQSESKAGRSSGGGSRGGGSRGSSHSWSSWSRPSSSVSKPSYSKPSHTVSKPSAPEHHSSSHSVGWNVHSSHGSQPAHNPHFSSHSSAGSLATGAAAYPRGPPSASVGGSHSYPASSGLSGSGTLQQTRVNPVSSGIGGSHSYPQGPPISASGSHSYPQSSGLSGSGTLQQTRVNPVSSGIGGSHSNPQVSPISASGSHSYPQSGGLSGSGTGYKPYTPVGSNVPSYPVSTGLSGGGVGAHATATNARPNYNSPPAYSGYNQPAYPPAYSVHAPSPSHSGYHPNPPAYGGYQAPPPAYGGYHPPPAYGGGYAHQPIYSGYSQPMYTPYNPTFVSHSSSGSGISNLLTGLAIYNLARSSGHHDTHVYHHDTVRHTYDRAPARSPAPIDSPSSVPLTDLSNCTLTLTTSNGTNVVGIPCGIASSFAPNVKVNDTTAPPIAQTNNGGDSCTISVVRKGVVENTKIPCDFLTKLQEDANKPLPGQINCTVLNPSDAYDPKVPPCRMISNTVNEEEFKVIPLKKPEPSPPEVIGSTPLASSTAAPPSIYPDLSQISTDIPAVVPLSGTVSSTTAPLPDSSSSPPNA